MAPHEGGVVRGVWGPPTATIDWCEQNYDVTEYVAEFWNTISNIMIIAPPVVSIYLSWKDGLENRLILCYLALTLVGIGSLGFHMTLTYEMQLMDELPMIWGSMAFIYYIYTSTSPPKENHKALVICLTSLAITISAVYVFIRNPIFHEVSIAANVSIALALQYYLIRLKRGSYKNFYITLVLTIIAFSIWNIDNLFCRNLKTARSHLPSLLKPLTQCHALWHVFSGYATYMHILTSNEIRMRHLNIKYKIFRHPVLGIHSLRKVQIDSKPYPQ